MAASPHTGDSSQERRQTFPRAHRLKRRRLIRPLFDRRRTDVGTVAVGCVRLVYRVVPRPATGRDVPLQIGFAPGRRRTAVRRNRVRRLLRETYRRRQDVLTSLFADDAERALVVMAIFRGRPEAAAERIPRDLPRAMRRLAEKV